MMRYFLYIIIMFSPAFGQGKGIPQRIVLNITEKPAESVSITWRTVENYENSEVRVAEAAADTSFADNVKAYPVNERYRDLIAKTGTGMQLFQVISVDGNAINSKSYTAAGDLFDSFELTKE